MKKIFALLFALMTVLVLTACGSDTPPEATDKNASPSEKYLEYNLDDTASFDGVVVPIDSTWSSLDFNTYNLEFFFKGSDDTMTAYSIDIRGYLNGETKDLATFESTWGYKTDYEIIEQWDSEEITYSIFARTADTGTWVSFLTGYAEDGKGFSVDFTLGEYSETVAYVNDSNKEKVIEYFKQVKWDPAATTVDSFDAYTAQKALSSSSSSSASASTQSTTPTTSQSNALRMAKQYLDYTAFSYSGLIEQLEYEGFSNADAAYGADNCGADWDTQAAKKAQEYLDYTAFSRQGLIEQLEYEGFTAEQAAYGASAVGL